MHKRMVNQAIIELTISPVGPLLIKASDQGADPTKPDMEFVETYRASGRSVYLPGSSLKGAIRAHCERIVRTLGGGHHNDGNVWACDPIKRTARCQKPENAHKGKPAAIYKHSCTICQIFGSSEIGAHLRIADAYPHDDAAIKLEERNGVAIDRIDGSAVSRALFNFQVLTAGKFTTKIAVKNFTTAQLALLAIAIRDFDEQRVSIGFAKSRGLGQVEMKVRKVKIHYPTAVLKNNQIVFLGRMSKTLANNNVVGAGELVSNSDRKDYGFPKSDVVAANASIENDTYGLGATLNFKEADDINDLWSGCVDSWVNIVQGVENNDENSDSSNGNSS